MAYQGPRLRGRRTSSTLYPLGQIPDSIILSIASNIVYLSAVGRTRLEGNDWGDIFAAALDATHFKSPIGIVDVALGNTAWSAKTVQSKNPDRTNQIRIISGRNNVGYSFNNHEPLTDIQETGRQVLEIWNARVEEAMEKYSQLRRIVLIRNMSSFRFKVFELPTELFDPADYIWSLNKSDNLEGDRIRDDSRAFTWQPNGAQFTVIQEVSGSARSFEIQKPQPQDSEQLLESIGYTDDWVTFL